MPFITPDKKNKDLDPKEPDILLDPKTEKKTLSQKISDYLLSFSRVPIKEKLVFVQNLSVMIKASIPVLSAFRTLAQQTQNKQFATILKQISLNLEQGSSLSDSLKKYPNVFSELFVSMVNSGEVSGKLEEVLHTLHQQTKKQYELTSRIKGALTYPAVIVVAMFGIGFFMMIYVIPKITSTFVEAGVRLPLPTRILIGASNLLAQHWLISILSIGIIIFLIAKILKTEKGKFAFQGLLLSLPIFGSIIKKINLARFARTTSSLLKTDIMIVKAFRITANVLGNLHYRRAVLEIGEKIKTGGQINEVVKNYPQFFPPMVIQMITVGEQTGEIGTILDDVATFYEDEVDQTMQNLPSIIEPVLILVLGLGVGAIAVAIIMPMYSLTTAI